MNFNKKVLLIGLLTVATQVQCYAQSLPDTLVKKVDSLFQQWSGKGSPGCAIGIIKDGHVIYAKGYGQANLEYGIANTPETIYHLASVSKQFTAWSILLLAQQGKIRLDDDIRKYLPWFPDLKQKITIQNLLNHTSGIRDQLQLLAIAGTRINDVITQEQVLKVLGQQRSLNFMPGEAYAYSNSNYTLLAEIVRAVTGRSLRQFTDSALFKPLGMSHTHFRDDYSEIEANRAYSYDRKDSAHFANSMVNYSTVGSTNLQSNIDDMSKWVMNLCQPKIGNRQTVAMLTKPGVLNNGEVIDYACGMITGTYNGWRQYWHNGSDAGFRTNVLVFPELNMGFLVFSNLGDIDAHSKTYELADLFVKNKSAPQPAKDSLDAVLKDPGPWKKYTGYYLDENGQEWNFGMKNGILYYNSFEKRNFLLHGSGGNFSFLTAPELKLRLSADATGTHIKLDAPTLDSYLTKDKKDTSKSHQSDAFLKSYTGIYYNAELDCKYGIALKQHHLVLMNNKYDDTPLNLVSPEHLTNNYWWIRHLTIVRNGQKQITAFDVDAGRGVRHLQFNKIN
jgi:CubicO group peptidase (beta-lactamase class C family)